MCCFWLLIRIRIRYSSSVLYCFNSKNFICMFRMNYYKQDFKMKIDWNSVYICFTSNLLIIYGVHGMIDQLVLRNLSILLIVMHKSSVNRIKCRPWSMCMDSAYCCVFTQRLQIRAWVKCQESIFQKEISEYLLFSTSMCKPSSSLEKCIMRCFLEIVIKFSKLAYLVMHNSGYTCIQLQGR